MQVSLSWAGTASVVQRAPQLPLGLQPDNATEEALALDDCPRHPNHHATGRGGQAQREYVSSTGIRQRRIRLRRNDGDTRHAQLFNKNGLI